MSNPEWLKSALKSLVDRHYFEGQVTSDGSYYIFLMNGIPNLIQNILPLSQEAGNVRERCLYW